MNVPYPLPTDVPYTGKKVKELFQAAGVPVAQWARENNYSTHKVYCVINGQFKGQRGEAHNIATALGMKIKPQAMLAA
jgi:gp16 family phage-associated protein